jgi:hypothetical protein
MAPPVGYVRVVPLCTGAWPPISIGTVPTDATGWTTNLPAALRVSWGLQNATGRLLLGMLGMAWGRWPYLAFGMPSWTSSPR